MRKKPRSHDIFTIGKRLNVVLVCNANKLVFAAKPQNHVKNILLSQSTDVVNLTGFKW